jgi:hypothetical protein
VTLDNVSNNSPEKWAYFEDMKIIAFMNLMLYYKDKQTQIEMRAAMQKIK